jgi:predicted transcriptional regulator
MASIDELILKTTKEIVVKFIETGRVGPAGFHEMFKTVYTTVEEIAKGSQQPPEQDTEETDS